MLSWTDRSFNATNKNIAGVLSCHKQFASESYLEVQGPGLEEMAGPHPLESHPSGPPGLLTSTALQTTENKPGWTRETEREDEQQGENMEELVISMTAFFFFP